VIRINSLQGFIFLILAILIAVSQLIILDPHLNYGFSDVDWGFLSVYKTQNPYSLGQFLDNIKTSGTLGGVYTHQIYYIGIQGDLFGLDFRSFHLTTHVFKTLSTVFSFFIFLALTRNFLASVVSTILFGFSYAGVGAMYTVVTSSDYLAILSLDFFIISYWYLIKNKISSWRWFVVSLILLMLTLFLSTERMYPLPLFILLTEALLLILNREKFTRELIFKRLLFLITPFALFFIATPKIFLDFAMSHIPEIITRISEGSWNLILTPFIALGSIVLPHDFTKYLGVIKMDSFFIFLDAIISGPLVFLLTITLIISILTFKKWFIAFLQITGLTAFFSIFLYILGSHKFDHELGAGLLMQALIGFFIISVGITSFNMWRKGRDSLHLSLFVGSLSALLYIVLTWLGAASAEIFTGVHRYLTIPALFMSLFVGALFSGFILNIHAFFKNNKFLRILSLVPLIFLAIYIRINIFGIEAFFNQQLYSGFGAEDKKTMRDQLLSDLENLDNQSPSLFYFDFSEDNINGYYYDNTLLGGFSTWMLWHPSLNFNQKLKPSSFWNNYKLLKNSYIIGKEPGFMINERMFPLKNFYAFKLKDKKITNIKETVLKSLVE